MGLYLCVFDQADELEGVEIGSYADFAFFRDHVTEVLENGITGAMYPTLMFHSDSDGEWSPVDCAKLKPELEHIVAEFRRRAPIPFHAEWQQQVGKSLGLKPSTLCDSFIDVDGEPLLDRLLHLCDVALKANQPILFQ